MEKITEIYKEERFRREIKIIQDALGDHVILLNGGAIFCYAQDFGLEYDRYPTDIDIAVDVPLNEAQKLLERKSIISHKETRPIKLWGLRYLAPCLVIKIGESSILVLNKSIIRDSYGREFRVDFGNNFYTAKSKKYGIRLASLEYLDLVKDFQSRPFPKSDFPDRDIISKMVNEKPELFNLSRYFKMRTAYLMNPRKI